jgi:hypothetical protein
VVSCDCNLRQSPCIETACRSVCRDALYYHATTRDYCCELFTVSETAKLLVNAQHMSTFGVRGVSAITVQNGITWLCPTASTKLDRTTYNNETKLFEPFQNVTTCGAPPPEFCQSGSNTCFTIPNNMIALTLSSAPSTKWTWHLVCLLSTRVSRHKVAATRNRGRTTRRCTCRLSTTTPATPTSSY